MYEKQVAKNKAASDAELQRYRNLGAIGAFLGNMQQQFPGSSFGGGGMPPMGR